jgi:hypothetical protein
MLLHHPEVATRKCSACALFMFCTKTGEGKNAEGKPAVVGEMLFNRGQPWKRPKTVPTPCSTCPKGSPEEAWKVELSERNQKAVELYLMMRSNPETYPLSTKKDYWVMRNKFECDRIYQAHDRDLLAQSIAAKLVPFMA